MVKAHSEASIMKISGLLVGTVLLCWGSTGTKAALPVLSADQLVFVNVDHAPIGTCSTFTFGYKGDICGIGTSNGNFPYWTPSGGGGGGVLIGLSNVFGLKLLPFVLSPSSIAPNASYFADAEIRRHARKPSAGFDAPECFRHESGLSTLPSMRKEDAAE